MSLMDSLIDEALVTISGSAVQRTVFIAIRNDGVSGSGTEEDPYNGATDALLDSILSNMPVNSEIRFGPGVFRTKGFGAGTSGFRPNSGQRFIGTGMYQTVLQLVKAASADDSDIIVVGVFSQGGTVDSIEIRDMTLDVNLLRQPLTSDGISKRRIKAQAINLSAGTNIRMRRVRVINWGTYTQTNEDFPIFIESPGFAALGENVVEECVIEQPDLSPAREESLLNNHAGPLSLEVFCTIRNNYLNGDFTTGSPPPALPVVNLYPDPNDITKMLLQTKWPHGLLAPITESLRYVGDEVYISGSPVSVFNARFVVRSWVDEYTVQIDKPAYSGNPFIAGMLAQRYVPQAMRVGIGYTAGIGSRIVTVTTPTPHLRKAGDWIRISGVLVGNSIVNNFNGSFKVLPNPPNVLNANQLQYLMDAPELAADTSSLPWLDRDSPRPGEHICRISDQHKIELRRSGICS